MKTISEQFKFRNVINLFLMMTFVLGMLTLAPADAAANPVPQQDTIGELEIDPFDPAHPFTPEGVKDPFAVDGRHVQDGRPDDWVSPEGDVMPPSAVPDPMMDEDPGLAWEKEATYSPRPERRPEENRVDRPLGSMIDPKRPQQDEPETREYALRSNEDQQRESDIAFLLGDAEVDRDAPFFYIDLSWNDIYGSNWTIGSRVDLTIDDPNIPGDVDYSDYAIVDDSGWIWFYTTYPFYLEPGQIVTLSDGSTTKTHTIIDLAVTSFDEAANTLSGTANPGSLHIYASNSPNMEEKWPVADGDGIWTETFVSVIVGPGFYAGITQSDDDGDTTYLEWYMPEPPNPYFRVFPLDDYIIGYDWSPNTQVELYVGSTLVGTSDSDDWGYVYFYPDLDVSVGQVLAVTDGIYTRTHTVRLEITDIDQDADIVSGKATPENEININACDDAVCEWLYPVADGEGNWSADFSGLVEITEGTSGEAYEYDETGNSTMIRWIVPDPYMSVYPDWDEIEGYDWPPNTLVTLTIGMNEWTQNSDSYGSVYFYPSFDIQPGYELVMTGGTYIRTHTVSVLSFTDFDEDAEIVSGIATPNREVEIDACDDSTCSWRYPVADENGDWSADFFESVDIAPGTSGWAYEYDDAGNSTRIRWFIPDPYISVYPDWDEIHAHEFLPETQITLTIGDDQWFQQSDTWGNAYFELDAFDIQPGQVVEITDSASTRTHTVSILAVTDINEDEDIVSGWATANHEIEIYGCDDFDCYWLFPLANEWGNWSVDFTDDLDIVPGISGLATEFDDTGNSTVVSWSVPDPYMSVYPDWDEVYGYDWPPNTLVTLRIGIDEWAEESDSHGWIHFYPSIDILPGHELVMTSGSYTRSYTVTNLAVTEVDQDLETVSGTANIGSEIGVDACAGDHCYWVDTIANEIGYWYADFSDIVDIASGAYGWAHEYDEAGHSTVIYWNVPDPYFQVYPLGDYIYGNGWTPNIMVTASVGGSSIGSGYSNSDGRVYISSYSYDITFGDTVQLTDGTYTRTHTVKNIVVTNVNQSTETVSGIAQANTALSYVSARDNNSTWAYRYPVVNADGNWSANFSGDVDITVGVYGWAVQDDEEGNETCIRWYVPDPTMTIYPEDDRVYGYDWLPFTTITLSIGTQSWTSESGYNGWVSFYTEPFNITTGQSVTMSGGGYLKAHNVRNLAVTTIDEVNDIVSGTSAASAQIVVMACDYYCNELTVTANSSGVWTADFDGLVDISPGASGSVTQFDEDGDSTRINWYVLDPYFVVYPNSDVIHGYDWLPNTPVSLTINDALIAIETSSDWGFVYFDDIAYDIQPGQTVVMLDGTYTKDHEVIDLGVTDYDSIANTLSGTANPGGLTIDAYDGSYGELLNIEANESGVWTASFSTMVIDVGVQAYVYQSDSDDDQTEIYWFIPDPRIIAYPEEDLVIGYDWPQNTQVTLTIENGRDSWMEMSNEYGSVYFNLESFGLQPGHEITMTAGTYTQEHTVKEITVTEIDQELDTIAGTAEPESEVVVCAIKIIGQNYLSECLTSSASSSGFWIANFSGLIDISSGTYGYVYQYDELNNYTQVYWEVELGNQIFLPLIVK